MIFEEHVESTVSVIHGGLFSLRKRGRQVNCTGDLSDNGLSDIGNAVNPQLPDLIG